MRLQDVLDGRNVHDKPSVATGDVNTKDGDQNQDCERVMGEHRLKERNGNDINEVVIKERCSHTKPPTKQRGFLRTGRAEIRKIMC